MSDPDETKWLGARLAGSRAESIAVVRSLVQAQGGAAESSVWSFGERLPAPQAAFLNGAMAATQLPGTPSNPMPESELHAKALACLGAGLRPMQHDAARRFAARIEAVDTATDMREFLSPTLLEER